MAAYDRRTFTGGAVATTLSAGIDASTLTVPIVASTGWPTGSPNGDFGAIINRGEADEEKVLCASRASLTVTLASGGRGVDGTTGQAHASGATIELVILARDLDEPNAHIADDALDHHSQYLNTARHDVEARHAFGAALGTPSAAADIGTVAATGTGDDAAREDHVHKIGTGAINAAGMFAAGVVDTAAIATGGVGSDELAADAVIAGKIADGAIDVAAAFVAGVVDTAAIAENAVGASELADGAVSTSASMSDAVVTMAKIASEAGTSFDPNFANVTLGSGGTEVGRYFKFGRLVIGYARFTLGSTGNVTGDLSFTVPFTSANVSDIDGLVAARATLTASRATGIGVIEPNSATAYSFATIGTDIWGASAPGDWNANDIGRFWFVYEAAT